MKLEIIEIFQSWKRFIVKFFFMNVQFKVTKKWNVLWNKTEWNGFLLVLLFFVCSKKTVLVFMHFLIKSSFFPVLKHKFLMNFSFKKWGPVCQGTVYIPQIGKSWLVHHLYTIVKSRRLTFHFPRKKINNIGTFLLFSKVSKRNIYFNGQIHTECGEEIIVIHR